jgi:hypothetical protein
MITMTEQLHRCSSHGNARKSVLNVHVLAPVQGTASQSCGILCAGSFMAGLFDGLGEYTWAHQPVQACRYAVPQATQGPCEVSTTQTYVRAQAWIKLVGAAHCQ